MGEPEDHVNAQLPLAGVVLCCTSIAPELRTELAEIAKQMGASHKFDLTSDVTHLLVGDIETNKYRYVARERPDVRVVLPLWLEAVRLSWMEGGETDVVALEREHKVPPLYNLRLTITGFDDLHLRQGLAGSIAANGAQYSGDLTKQITHLIAAKPEGKKYAYARQWGIKVVSLRWLNDSLTRGMALDEGAYDPLVPEEEQGEGAYIVAKPAAAVGKRARPESQQAVSGEAQVRKLRRTASTKLGSQNESLWADITSHPSNDNRRKSDGQWLDLNKQSPQGATLPLAPTAAIGGNIPRPSVDLASKTLISTRKAESEDEGIFRQRVVFIHGFDEKKTAILHQHLSANGALVYTAPAELEELPLEDLETGFLIIPNEVPLERLPPIPEPAERLSKVTNWWVEKCLHEKHYIDPTGNALLRPFLNMYIDDFKGLSITSTGCTGIDLLHVSKAVNVMGGVYEEYLKPTTSVLICGLALVNEDKLKLAAKNSIPAVAQDWLLHSVEFGDRRPYKQYLVQPIRSICYDTSEELIEKPTTQLSEEGKTAIAGRKLLTVSSEREAEHRKVPQRATSIKPKRKLGGKLPSIPDQLDDSISKPLAELPQAPTSPRRRSTTSTNTSGKSHKSASDENWVLVSRPTSPVPGPVLTADKPLLDDAIAALLAQKQASRATSATVPEVQETNRQRRRRGLLGRANSSATSNPSTNDTDANVQNNPAKLGGVSMGGPESFPQDADPAMVEQDAPPQTQLVYDNPEARRAREILLTKMGGKIEKEATPSKGIGVVKDLRVDNGSGAIGGTTTRQGRRRR